MVGDNGLIHKFQCLNLGKWVYKIRLELLVLFLKSPLTQKKTKL